MSVPRKRHKPDTNDTDDAAPTCLPTCIIHYEDCKSETINLLADLKDPAGRFQKIQDVCKQRLSEPLHSIHRRTTICEQVPTSYAPELKYGYHRECYQKFAGNLSRLKGESTAETPVLCPRRPPRRSSTESDRHIFKPDCIFCRKEGKKKVKIGKSWTSEPLIKFECDGGDTILCVAEQKKDFELLRRIKGYDLFACEAQAHSTCRKLYVNISVHWRSDSLEAKTKQSSMEMAHQSAYNTVCATVEKKLIVKQGIVKLTDLQQQYVSVLEQSPFPNANYRSENLAAKLTKSYPQTLSFAKLEKKGKFQSQLVYSSAIEVGSAVSMAYELSTIDRTRDVALHLRNEIKNSFESSNPLRWPPTAKDLDISDSVIPEQL